jgi:hypothetical protein
MNEHEGETGLMPEGIQRPRPNADTIPLPEITLPFGCYGHTEEITNFLSGTPTRGQGQRQGQNNEGESSPDNGERVSRYFDLGIVRLKFATGCVVSWKKAAENVEVLAHITAPYSERPAKLLYNCSGYARWQHRYGSARTQTLLQLAVTSKNDSDLALHEDAHNWQITLRKTCLSRGRLVARLLEELAPCHGIGHSYLRISS